MLVVIVTGPTCSGKTTLAREISERFSLPLFHKDGFKEAMFDITIPAVAEIDRDFSRLLGRFSLACLEVVLLQCARSGASAVFEANFDSHLFSPRLAAIRQRHPMRILQAHLRSVGAGQTDTEREDALLARFAARESTDRHPGHGAWRQGQRDSRYGLPEGFGGELLRLHTEDQPLLLEPDDDLVELDTTNFSTVDFEPLFGLVEQRLARINTDR